MYECFMIERIEEPIISNLTCTLKFFTLRGCCSPKAFYSERRIRGCTQCLHLSTGDRIVFTWDMLNKKTVGYLYAFNFQVPKSLTPERLKEIRYPFISCDVLHCLKRDCFISQKLCKIFDKNLGRKIFRFLKLNHNSLFLNFLIVEEDFVMLIDVTTFTLIIIMGNKNYVHILYPVDTYKLLYKGSDYIKNLLLQSSLVKKDLGLIECVKIYS